MRILIVRHAETIENTFRICQGQMDGQLSEKGHWEAEQVALRLKDIDISVCYTSDLKRASDTCARIAVMNPHLSSVRPDVRLRERFFGSMQGKVFPPDYDETQYPPETEPVTDMAQRLRDLLNDLIDLYAGTDKTILLVSHGFTIRVLVAILRGFALEKVWTVPEILNTSVTVFDHTLDKGWIERLFNDASHTAV